MKIRRILAIAKKETQHLVRDWRSLVLSLAIPIFLLGLFGYALTLDIRHIATAVWDQAETPESRETLSKLFGSSFFRKVALADSYEEIDRLFLRRDALVAIVIPAEFSRTDLGTKHLQLLVDGTDANTSRLAMHYAESALSPAATAIDLHDRLLFNPNGDSTLTIVPGLTAVIMMVIAALLTSSAISKERERGTFERLIVSPLTPTELIAGKLLPYLALGFCDLFLIMICGKFFFGMTMHGSYLLFIFLSALFLIASLAIGMAISSATKSQLVSSQLAMISTFLPTILLSGFLTPIQTMPWWLQAVSQFVPARYYISATRAIYLKGAPFSTIKEELTILALFALIMLTVAIYLTSRQSVVRKSLFKLSS